MKNHALGRRQQLVAPVERGAQGLMAWHRRAVAAREQPEPVIEPCRKPLNSQSCSAGRGQFDGQRNAVEPPADCGHRSNARVGRQLRIDRARSRQEQPHGAGLQQLFPIHDLFRRHVERRNLIERLTLGTQRFTAGGKYTGGLAGPQDRFRHVRCRVDHVLAVVEDEQEPLRVKGGRHPLR